MVSMVLISFGGSTFWVIRIGTRQSNSRKMENKSVTNRVLTFFLGTQT